MKKIIDSPFADCRAILNISPKKMIFRREEFDVYDYYYVCEKTKKEFSTSETNDITLSQLYNQYREKHNMLFPEQLKELREKYDLSPAKMSHVLGFGENVWRTYEKGEIPNESNSNLIDTIRDPKIFLDRAIKSKALDNYELEKIRKIVQREENLTDEEIVKRHMIIYDESVNQYTGYAKRNLDKFGMMVIFFLEKGERTFTTRLNKYLFYSDFLNFKFFGKAISGYAYCKLPRGPVPDRYKDLYSALWEKNYIELKEIELKGEIQTFFKAAKEFEKNLFSRSEIELMELILRSFKYKDTGSVINSSHDEMAWKETPIGSPISYQKFAPLIGN